MSAEDVRAHFASLDSCTAHLKIISDLDESVLEFESDYVYNREDSDSFTPVSYTHLDVYKRQAEDDTAAIELVVFPRSLQQCGAYLTEDSAVLLTGKIDVYKRQSIRTGRCSVRPCSCRTAIRRRFWIR